MSNATMITFSGNLADAPELKVTPNGKATARMRVAVDSRRRDAAGEWVDGTTTWYTVITWDHLAENLAENLGKGDRVLVQGRLEAREWDGDDGAKHTVWEVTAEDAGPSLRMPARAIAAARDNSPAPRVATRPAPRTSPTQTPHRNGTRQLAGKTLTNCRHAPDPPPEWGGGSKGGATGFAGVRRRGVSGRASRHIVCIIVIDRCLVRCLSGGVRSAYDDRAGRRVVGRGGQADRHQRTHRSGA
jgi:single-strand DNA-binding protein